MTHSFSFTVPGIPQSQGSLRRYGKHLTHDNPKLDAWRRLVAIHARNAALKAGWQLPIDQPVTIEAVFHLPPPQRPRWPVPAVKPDLDKLQRAIGDALSPRHGAQVLKEDSRIWKWVTEKQYSPTPHATITITPTAH